MNDGPFTPAVLRRALPALVLLAASGMLLLSSPAVGADDPPIVSHGPIEVGGTPVTASVGNNPNAEACIGDDHSGADTADSGLTHLNEPACQEHASGGTGTTGSARPSGTAGGSGAAGTSSAQTSIAAADAVGLRIINVKRLLRNVRLTKSFRMLVTVRDGRGFRVRGAIVSVSRVPGSKTTISGIHANFSNKTGVANVLVPATKKMFGNRVFLKITARAPRAQAVTLRSVSLPRLR